MRRAERLLELQKVDLALEAARKRLREIDGLLTESDTLRVARQADQRLHDRLAQLRARSKDLDLQSTTLDDKIKSVDDRLYSGVVKNPKELSDLQKDAAALRRQKSGLDDTLLEVIYDIEQTEREYRAAHAELERAEAGWRGEQAALIDERAALNEQVAAREAERQAQRANIDSADLAIYDQLRANRRGQAVAVMEDNVCSACGVEPSANKRAHLMRDDALIACGNCERILLAV